MKFLQSYEKSAIRKRSQSSLTIFNRPYVLLAVEFVIFVNVFERNVKCTTQSRFEIGIKSNLKCYKAQIFFIKSNT